MMRSKNLRKCFEGLNIDNINFPPTIRDIEQFDRDNPDISITIFACGSFHKIKEDDNINENTKEGTVIKDVRVAPYALKRKHLVELLIIMHYIPLCTNVENVLTIILELNKNDAVKFRDYHMQKMQPFMIIADYETYTNKLNQIKPYSFVMFTHCIFNESNNKFTFSHVKIAWMNFLII